MLFFLLEKKMLKGYFRKNGGSEISLFVRFFVGMGFCKEGYGEGSFCLFSYVFILMKMTIWCVFLI